MPLDPNIYFFVVVPGDGLKDISLMQGFSMSLCEESHIIMTATLLPTNVHDLADYARESLIARRMSGTFPVHWHAQSPRAILSSPPSAFPIFSLIILPTTEAPQDYNQWIKSSSRHPTLVAKSGAELSYDDLTVHGLQAHLLKVCDRWSDMFDDADLQVVRDALNQWKPLPKKRLSYQVGGHNSVRPNVAALEVAGYEDLVYGRFDKQAQGLKPYVEQIVLTTNSIFDERKAVGPREMNRFYPPPPDLNLFAPSIYPHFFSFPAPDKLDHEEKRRFENVRSAFKRQSGYAFEATTDSQVSAFAGKAFVESGGKAKATPHPFYFLRAKEQRLATNAMAALAASEFSAVIRLPNEINRSAGAIRAFAEHYRSQQPKKRKRLEAFRKVQARLAAGVPSDFLDLIRQSTTGLRIISDAHLEWLDLDGLPLSIRKDCTRIPVTPGNLFINQIAAQPAIHLTPESFSKILVVSALKRTDPINGIFETAFSAFEPQWRDQIQIQFAEVRNKSELVDALNKFDGPMVVFDGHGSHKANEPAALHLQDEAVDIWSLNGQIHHIPPIVVLSACDTHAADRNHATTANGFMLLGARTVLSSVFPLYAASAATFVARLVFRIAGFLKPAINIFDRSLLWSEVVSGMLRMHLLTDFLRQLLSDGQITDEMYEEIHSQGNLAINGSAPDPFELVISLLEAKGLARQKLKLELATVVAHSSAISYLQIGRPETIVIDDETRIKRQIELMQKFIARDSTAI
ncbi:MAG: CHAT domain-containing protein [Reyranella sp.]|nr:CHAT domain-containing protein [Reyranella sp.]